MERQQQNCQWRLFLLQRRSGRWTGTDRQTTPSVYARSPRNNVVAGSGALRTSCRAWDTNEWGGKLRYARLLSFDNDAGDMIDGAL